MVILGRQTAVAIVTHWAMRGALISVPWTALSLSHSLLFHVRINTICRKVVPPPHPARVKEVTTFGPFIEIFVYTNDVQRDCL